MNSQMIIVLCLLVFLVVMLFTNKLPYGVTGMICCVLLVVTGVLDMQTAFSGISNSTTIMVAPILVIASLLGKTSLIGRLKSAMRRLEGKSTPLLILGLSVITILMSQLLDQLSCISVMLLFVQTFDEDSDLSPLRVLFFIMALNCVSSFKIPLGMGATMPGTISSYYQGLVGPEDLLGITDFCKAGLLPMIVGIVYILFMYKLIPNGGIDKGEVKEIAETETMSKRDEYLVFAAFIIVMLGFAFSSRLGNNIGNVIPAACVLALIVLKVVSTKEAILLMTSDMIWLVASMSVFSLALSQTGVGELIGQTILRLLGGNPSGLLVSIVLCVVCVVMTNFMSNMATMALMCPIAASTALAGGMNVKAVVLTCCVSAWFSFVMPIGCSTSMVAFGVSKQSPVKLMKFTLPLLLVEMVALIIGINIFFPIFG